MHFSKDTIVARATPSGRGGVGIIRISGPDTQAIAEKILGCLPKPRFASYGQFMAANGDIIDQGVALYFKAPHSFTGEDVLELQGHGGMIVMDLLLQCIVGYGARLARPGEFTERAFLNNKIDLTQAEAIADLIEAQSAQAARSAMQSLRGVFSNQINALVENTIQLRMHVEAAIDFPEEEIDFLSDGIILGKLHTLIEQLNGILHQAQQGNVLREGMKVVIAGFPNAGKSSLLNALSGDETAIVSEIPGTTRDILRENIHIDGIPLHILDTAGLRDSSDTIEKEGVKRAWKEIPQADRILLVIDANEVSHPNLDQHDLVNEFSEYQDKLTIVRNKIDLTSEAIKSTPTMQKNIPVISLSAMTGEGLDLLRSHLKTLMGHQGGENVFIARRRHLEILHKSQLHLFEALNQLEVFKAGELVAQELREAQNALSEITGEFRSDDLLGKIFSSFCIGK